MVGLILEGVEAAIAAIAICGEYARTGAKTITKRVRAVTSAMSRRCHS